MNVKVSYNRTTHVIGCIPPAFSYGIPADPLIRFRTHVWVTILSIFGVGFSDGSNLQSHPNGQRVHLDYLIVCLDWYDVRLGYAFLFGIAGWLRKVTPDSFGITNFVTRPLKLEISTPFPKDRSPSPAYDSDPIPNPVLPLWKYLG